MGALGLLFSLVTFLRSEIAGRKSKEEILNALESDRTIQDYLEWLRRQDMGQLLQQIEGSKTQLLEAIGDLGDALIRAAETAVASAGDAATQIQILNERISLPVLSPVAVPTRYGANITLRGREHELERLANDKDTLVYGQPGSGKTSLLQTFAKSTGAQFILSDNADAVVGAIVLQRPNTVVIDDAGPRQDLIRRLQHLREERGVKVRVIMVCWPFEKDELQHLLRLRDEQTLELGGLSRKIIAEVIRDIAKERHVEVSDDFIRVVAKQALGKPGLAASLTLATLESSGEALVSGELLLKDLDGFLRRYGGDEAIDVLSAVACGGRGGISIDKVAATLGKPITEIMATTRRVALAGVLQETERNTLVVQPDFLRSALLKKSFFPSGGVALPWDVCRSLIESAKDPVSGYLELIHAYARGATIDRNVLRELVLQAHEARLWEAMAWVDEESCSWVMENTAEWSSAIKKAALHYIPERVIPGMLASSAIDKRPLNAFPDADIRLLEDWVAEGSNAEAFRRRETLFKSAIQSLKAGVDERTVTSAMRFVFSLKCHMTDSDPADPRTFRWRDWLLPLGDAEKVFGLWDEFVQMLNSLKQIPWNAVIDIVENWIHATRPRGKALPQKYIEFINESSAAMIASLVPLAGSQQAVLRWLYSRSKDVGLGVADLPLSADFMVLFPQERFDDDWQQREQRQISAVEKLADSWSNKPFSEIVETISEWQAQADQLARVWPQWGRVFCSRLATLYKPNDEELSLAIAKLAPSNVIPFLEAAASNDSLNDQHIKECLERPQLEGVIVDLVLSGKLPRLYRQLQDKLGRWKDLIETRCLRAEVPDDVLELLLADSDPVVKLETALGMFRARDRKPIAEKFDSAWTNAIVEGVALVATQDIDSQPYDLDKILAHRPGIRKPILDKILATGESFHGVGVRDIFPLLVSGLGKEDRRELLKKCRHLTYSSLPSVVVGRDAELYAELLAIPELKHFHLNPLCGDPNEADWVTLAKLALAAGYSPRSLSSAVNSGGFSWTGHLSTYYDNWVQSFSKLSQNNDPDVQAIATDGLKWATAARDHERKREKIEEIEGWD